MSEESISRKMGEASARRDRSIENGLERRLSPLLECNAMRFGLYPQGPANPPPGVAGMLSRISRLRWRLVSFGSGDIAVGVIVQPVALFKKS